MTQSKRSRRLAIDAAVGLGLVLMLVVVLFLDRRSTPEEKAVATGHVKEVDVLGGLGSQAGEHALRLAVTPPEYDDMGRLLDTLGGGYRYTTIAHDDLLDPKRLAPFDVVFLTCSGNPPHWLGRSDDGPARSVAEMAQIRSEVVAALNKSLREYVSQGGTLYVSDLHFDLLGIAFPERVDRPKAGRGAVQTIRADVVDRGLYKWLGPAIELRFEMPAWRPAAFIGPDVTTYLQGSYTRISGQREVVPLLVSFPLGSGMVVFTSFHNEAQNNAIEQKLLRYLVFRAVTASEEEKVKQTLIRGGFSPETRGILRPLSDKEEVTETYDCTKGGHLQFVLGFRDQGATLRLTVIAPDGRRFEKQGTKTFMLDVAHAAPGVWKYTISPIQVPYPNFPFTLTIGEKQ